MRAVQTAMKLGGAVHGPSGKSEEAVKWMETGVRGFRNLYGEHHDRTHDARAALLRVYKC